MDEFTTATCSVTTTPAGHGGFATKRQKVADLSSTKTHHQQLLLPGLPDHVAQLCLSRVPPSALFNVCRSWRQLIYSPSFPPFLSLYALLIPTDATTERTQSVDSINFFSFDPISSRWRPLPQQPEPPQRLLVRHPSFISRNLPIQSVSAAGRLVLLAATAKGFLPALPRPIVFDPISRSWAFGPPLASPRRWCAAGESGGAVYVASGMGAHYNFDVARSVEKWDLQDNHHQRHQGWKKLGALRDGKFCRDAIDFVSWRGNLWMVNIKGCGPKEGVSYDVINGEWKDMPERMSRGWRGPVAAMDEETLYTVDEAEGVLRKYDEHRGAWVDVWEEERLKGAEQMAAAGGRVCVVCSGGAILVVDVVASPPRSWVVETPAGYRAMTVHILPRMTKTELDQ